MNMPNWELLNAYVDGELSTEESLQVVEAMAAKPEIAAQVATLMRLKACTSNVPERLAPLVTAPYKPPFSAASRVLFGVCAILLLLSVGFFQYSRQQTDAGHRAMELVSEATLWHTRWLSSVDHSPAHSTQHAQALLRQAGIDTSFVAALDGIDLRLTLVEPWSSARAPALHLGYEGPNGCQISLFVQAEQASFHADRQRRGKAWTWANLDFEYIAFADNMDPQRFADIVTWLQTLTRHWRPMDAQQRTQLLASRAVATPCG